MLKLHVVARHDDRSHETTTALNVLYLIPRRILKISFTSQR